MSDEYFNYKYRATKYKESEFTLKIDNLLPTVY